MKKCKGFAILGLLAVSSLLTTLGVAIQGSTDKPLAYGLLALTAILFMCVGAASDSCPRSSS